MRISITFFTLCCLLAGLSVASDGSGTVLFILDVSGSMAQTLEDETKMDVAKRVFTDLLDDLPPFLNVGLMVYGHYGNRDCSAIEVVAEPQPLRVAAIQQQVRRLAPKNGATPIAAAIERAAQVLRNASHPRTIVLITDGKETCDGNPVATVQRLRNSGIEITVHVVGFAVRTDEAEQLRALARAGAGHYYPAQDAEALRIRFQEVRQRVVASAAPLRFRDDFDGPELRAEWRLQGPDPDQAVLDQGKFVILNAAGDFDARPVNLLLWKNALRGERMVVEAEFATAVVEGLQYFRPGDYRAGSMAGLVLYRDARNFLRLFITATRFYAGGEKGARVVFAKRAQGKEGKPFEVDKILRFGDGAVPRTYRLRIEKNRFRYSGYYYHFRKKTWVHVGTYAALGQDYVPGFFATRGKNGLEVTTELDWFAIRSLETTPKPTEQE